MYEQPSPRVIFSLVYCPTFLAVTDYKSKEGLGCDHDVSLCSCCCLLQEYPSPWSLPGEQLLIF